RTETVASTVVGGCAVVELLAHLQQDGREMAWPVAVVAESPDDWSVVFRAYCSQWPIFGRHYVRAPILKPQPGTAGDVVGRYQAGVAAGDADAVVSAFEPDGYFRGATGPDDMHRGQSALRSYFTRRLSAGGIGVQDCAVTDDGTRCAVEYNIVRWGEHDLPAQAGIAVFERGPGGLLAAARIYDDVQPPAEIQDQ
ncbi:MAG: nuclear transport factor 2 family protein, partial [Streptosporangiaceae bacterium]